MKVLIAIDSFKGSMTSMEAGNSAKDGILKAMKDAEVVVKPLADGGEGTTEALVEGLGGKQVTVCVQGPMDRKTDAVYGILPDGITAVIEMAAASGIILSGNEKNPMKATSYGTGELILDAVKKGCRKFIIGIGGSATNDGGIGMLQALGYQFKDKDGKEVSRGAEALGKIRHIDDSLVYKELKECEFKIACDVKNPLCGINGATYIYGPQKGVTEELRDEIENGMKNYAMVTKEHYGKDVSEYPGTGAAGGLGFAFLAYLHAELVSGIELVMNVVGLEKEIQNADIVITGEGRLDEQTAMGKVPVGIAKIAKKYGKPVIALAGGVTDEAAACNEEGIDAFFPIVRGVTTLEDAMRPEEAKKNMRNCAEQIFRLVHVWK